MKKSLDNDLNNKEQYELDNVMNISSIINSEDRESRKKYMNTLDILKKGHKTHPHLFQLKKKCVPIEISNI